eukprot:6172830-Pleurochrysis_carterae.AAC.2
MRAFHAPSTHGGVDLDDFMQSCLTAFNSIHGVLRAWLHRQQTQAPDAHATAELAALCSDEALRLSEHLPMSDAHPHLAHHA